MRLKLNNGLLRIADGDIGAQFSANVRITLDNDKALTGYIPALLVKYQAEDGELVEGVCQMVDGEFVIPADAYKTTQVIMLTVSNVKGNEVLNSQPLYVRINAGNAGGAEILPSDEQTWQTLVKAYVDSLLAATNEKISQLEQSGVGLSDDMKKAWKGHLTEIAYASASHPFTDALIALLEGEETPDIPDVPVTPPEDEEPDEPVDNKTYYQDAIMNAVNKCNATAYSGDTTDTSTVSLLEYGIILVESNWDHDVDVHFHIVIKNGAGKVGYLMSYPQPDPARTQNWVTAYGGKTHSSLEPKLRTVGISNYYTEGSGSASMKEGNVYDGVYNLKAGHMFVIANMGGYSVELVDKAQTLIWTEE